MRLSALVAALALVGGCDFSPTLDIETPEYRPALALAAVLYADSMAHIRVTASSDPYGPRPNSQTRYEVLRTATVTLSRDGGPPEALSLRSRRCDDPYAPPVDGQLQTYECGGFASAAPLQGGATYTVRADAPGLPPVEATVTIPVPVPATATRERGTPSNGLDTDRLTLRFHDVPGLGQRYSLDALLGGEVSRHPVCSGTPPVCRDTTYTSPFFRQTSFTTQDPVLVVGLRGVPGTTNVVTFTDELFDGQDRSFTIEALVYGYSDDQIQPPRRIVRLLSVSEPLYQAYQQAFYSFGDGNPFREPADLPSNVRGGYGLVGAAAVTEIDLGPS
jgi:hypothetical protein